MTPMCLKWHSHNVCLFKLFMVLSHFSSKQTVYYNGIHDTCLLQPRKTNHWKKSQYLFYSDAVVYIYRFQCIHYIGTCIAIKIFEWILYGFTRASNDVYMDRYIFFSCYLSCPKDIILSNQGCYTTTSLSRGMFYLSVHLP